jgi:hypothetical protein
VEKGTPFNSCQLISSCQISVALRFVLFLFSFSYNMNSVNFMNVGVIFCLNKITCDVDVLVTEKSEVESENHLY